MLTQIIREDTAAIVRDLAAELRSFGGNTVLVTGATGFLGSYFLDVFRAFNEANPATPVRVVALDNGRVGLPARVSHLAADPNFSFRQVDISQPIAVERADYIIHCAGIGSPKFYRAFPLETILVNIDGTRNVLELAARVNSRSVISYSSSEIYGDPDPAFIPTPESYRGNVACIGPRACYDESKRLGETLCMAYHKVKGVPVKVIRPFNVFGPGQRIDDGRIVPDLLGAALENRPIALYSDGRATRSFCYGMDFVRGSLQILTSGADGEVFNLGNDTEVSIREAAETMAAVHGDLRIEYRRHPDAEYLVDNPQRRCPDLTKVRTEIGYRPRVTLAEGFARCLASCREEAGRRAAAE
jgi:UDP-glucuronate decarboxylase